MVKINFILLLVFISLIISGCGNEYLNLENNISNESVIILPTNCSLDFELNINKTSFFYDCVNYTTDLYILVPGLENYISGDLEFNNLFYEIKMPSLSIEIINSTTKNKSMEEIYLGIVNINHGFNYFNLSSTNSVKAMFLKTTKLDVFEEIDCTSEFKTLIESLKTHNDNQTLNLKNNKSSQPKITGLVDSCFKEYDSCYNLAEENYLSCLEDCVYKKNIAFVKCAENEVSCSEKNYKC